MAEQKHGPLRTVSIRVLEGGYIGSCSYDPLPVDTKGDKCCPSPAWTPDREYSLPTDEAAVSFVERALDGKQPYKPRGGSDDEKWENAGKDAKAQRAAK